MATIDIKLKSYDELIFEITKLNTDKYLLEQENKQLKDLLNKANDEVVSYTNCCIDLQQRIDKAIEYLKTFHFIDNIRVLDVKEYEKLLEILGDKE